MPQGTVEAAALRAEGPICGAGAAAGTGRRRPFPLVGRARGPAITLENGDERCSHAAWAGGVRRADRRHRAVRGRGVLADGAGTQHRGRQRPHAATGVDQLVQRAHRTLSFQLSGAQVGISITTLITGYLAEPLIARLLHPVLTALGLPEDLSLAVALVLALVIATSVSMVFGELVPKNLAVARPVPTARAAAGPQVLFSMLLTPLIRLTNGTANWILRRMGIEPAEELRSARSPQELGVAGAQLGPPRLPGHEHRDAGGPITAVRHPHRRGADDSAHRDRGAARRRHRH